MQNDVNTRFNLPSEQNQTSKRGNTSKTRRTRISDGECTQKYMTRGKRSPTMYCAVYTRFPPIKRINPWLIPSGTTCHLPFDKKGRLSGVPYAEGCYRKPLFPRLLCAKGAVMRSMTEGLSARIRVSLCRAKQSAVKTRRYKQDAKGADFAQRVYSDVNEQAKTQGRQCIAQ